MKKIAIIMGLVISLQSAMENDLIVTGTIIDENAILFENGSGYYTDVKLQNVGEEVLILFDTMVSSQGLTNLNE